MFELNSATFKYAAANNIVPSVTPSRPTLVPHCMQSTVDKQHSTAFATGTPATGNNNVIARYKHFISVSQH